jgi:hypothetical protein
VFNKSGRIAGDGSVRADGKKILFALNKCGQVAGTKKNKKPSLLLIKADGISQSAFAKCGLVTLVKSAQTVLVSCF